MALDQRVRPLARSACTAARALTHAPGPSKSDEPHKKNWHSSDQNHPGVLLRSKVPIRQGYNVETNKVPFEGFVFGVVSKESQRETTYFVGTHIF